jgi:hypothetical protein
MFKFYSALILLNPLIEASVKLLFCLMELIIIQILKLN